MTSAPAISTSSSSGLTCVISLVLAATSRWASTARAPQIIAASRCGALPSAAGHRGPSCRPVRSAAPRRLPARLSPALSARSRTRRPRPGHPACPAPAGTSTATVEPAARAGPARRPAPPAPPGGMGRPLADRCHRIGPRQYRSHRDRQHGRHPVPDAALAPRLGHCLQAFQQPRQVRASAGPAEPCAGASAGTADMASWQGNEAPGTGT